MSFRALAPGRGFTLLEVLVAIAILGLGLTAILSSQMGLFSSASRAEHLSIATNLARCRMAEVELELIQEGYPLIDQKDDGRCCGDDDALGYRCAWKIERIELPQPRTFATGPDGEGGLGSSESLGALAALTEIEQSGGASLGETPDIGSLAGSLGEAASAGIAGIAPLVMGLVYPDLKPMLEASIRKVTVVVHWKEGRSERDLLIVQYLTDPQQGGLDPAAADGVQQLAEQLEQGGGT